MMQLLKCVIVFFLMHKPTFANLLAPRRKNIVTHLLPLAHVLTNGQNAVLPSGNSAEPCHMFCHA